MEMISEYLTIDHSFLVASHLQKRGFFVHMHSNLIVNPEEQLNKVTLLKCKEKTQKRARKDERLHESKRGQRARARESARQHRMYNRGKTVREQETAATTETREIFNMQTSKNSSSIW